MVQPWQSVCYLVHFCHIREWWHKGDSMGYYPSNPYITPSPKLLKYVPCTSVFESRWVRTIVDMSIEAQTTTILPNLGWFDLAVTLRWPCHDLGVAPHKAQTQPMSPSLFFIPSDSYYFSFFLLILLRSPFPTPFFTHSLRHCLQFLPFFSFWVYPPSLTLLTLHPYFIFHLLFLIILFCIFLVVCSFLRILLSFAPFSSSSSSFSSSFISSSFSSSPAFLSFIHFSCSFLLILLLFFLLLPSFLFTFSIFSSFSSSCLFISSSLLHSPPSLFSFFEPFSFAYL